MTEFYFYQMYILLNPGCPLLFDPPAAAWDVLCWWFRQLRNHKATNPDIIRSPIAIPTAVAVPSSNSIQLGMPIPLKIKCLIEICPSSRPITLSVCIMIFMYLHLKTREQKAIWQNNWIELVLRTFVPTYNWKTW